VLWVVACCHNNKRQNKVKTKDHNCRLWALSTNDHCGQSPQPKVVYGFFVVLVKAHSPKPFFVMAYGHSPEKTKKSLSSAAFLRLPLLWDPPTAHNRMLLWPMRGARIFLLLWPTATTTYGYGRSPETKGVA
jgi:hypothetical protein